MYIHTNKQTHKHRNKQTKTKEGQSKRQLLLFLLRRVSGQLLVVQQRREQVLSECFRSTKQSAVHSSCEPAHEHVLACEEKAGNAEIGPQRDRSLAIEATQVMIKPVDFTGVG